MEKINCNISINTENFIIKIKGLKEDNIEISYSGDVDYTELVNSLIIIIDEQKQIEYSIENISNDDEKLKLVADTLKEILNEYNKNINSIEDMKENEVNDFGRTNGNDNTYNLNDDLPF